MQGATHHEAVSALRNAGSCIKMKVLRERLLPREVRDPEGPQDPPEVTGRQLCGLDGGGQRVKQPKTESAEDGLTTKIEAVVCNGNGIVGGLLKSQSIFSIVPRAKCEFFFLKMTLSVSFTQFYTLLFVSLVFLCFSLIWRVT